MSNDRRTREPRRSPVDGEEIRSLLVAAGRRAEVPESDLATIRAAARAEWQELVATRRAPRVATRRLVPALLATGLFLALAVGWWWRTRTPPVDTVPLATVELLRGDVQVRRPADRGSGEPLEPTVGDVLVAGTTLTTEAERSPGIVALRLTDGESVRLGSGTRVRLESSRRLAIEIGTLYADSGVAAAGGEGLEIVTPWGSVRDVGTQFEVRVAEGEDVALRVRVREGGVAVASGGESHTVAGGQELRMHGDGTVSRHQVARYGPAWEWTLAAAPSIDAEDLPLSTFLEWVSRETGWELRYTDPELARSAPEIRVSADIEGLTPEEAVSVVLPASLVEYRVEDGTLLVTRTRN